ncbi:MAG: hypothetical protein JRI23_13770 [Deltaproteobacteria bacterium]|jgi:hypothetical protein|nr:hypothetical protein [Deltaproteobacteria bacterium]MBW2532797.1 hypothetical protein [Deltaproteobacteria bacterium]
MGLIVTFADGQAAELIRVDGDRVELRAPRAAAPGSRLSATLDDGRELRLKAHRSVRSGDTFTIAGRLIDATRELRRHLQQRVPSS